MLAAIFLAAGMLSPKVVAIRAAPASQTPSFSRDVFPILRDNCMACHSSAVKMGGLVMESYDMLMKGGKDGQVIVPGKAAESRMILMLEGKVKPQMPFGGNPLPADQLSLLKAWIDSGAAGPALGEAPVSAQPNIPNIKPEVPVVSPIGSLAFSPDGKMLAVGGYQEVELLDPASGKVLAALKGHADLVRSLAWTPDGRRLAAAGGLPQRGGEIKIWDLASRTLSKTLNGHTDCIYSVAASPDGKLVASASYDKVIKLWNIETGAEVRTLKDHIDAVFAVAFSPDGKRLASGAQDRTVKIWDVATGERLYTLSEALDSVTAIAFSPSGAQLAAAGADKTIRTYALGEKSGSLLESVIADEDTILELAYTPDGKTLISSSADRSIRFRDAATLFPKKVLDNQPDWVEALSVSPDGKWLAAGRYDGSVSLYNLANYEQALGPLVAFVPATGAPKGRESALR